MNDLSNERIQELIKRMEWEDRFDSDYVDTVIALKELLTLRQQNAELIAEQKKTKIHIDDMVKISGEMAQENAEWKQDAERLAKPRTKVGCSYCMSEDELDEINNALKHHQALMEKYGK